MPSQADLAILRIDRLRLGSVGAAIHRTDLLERPIEVDGAGPEVDGAGPEVDGAGPEVDLGLPMTLSPFEIVTQRIQRG